MCRKNLIMFPLLLICACTPLKNAEKTANITDNKQFIELQKIKALNISGRDYSILKAVVKISSAEEKNEFLVNFRFQKPDTFMFSMKSKIGMEAARVLISKDTILINDRLNRRLYYGSSSYLFEKYGVNINNLHIIMGDLITRGLEKNDTLRCENGEAIFSDQLGGRKIEYKINCKTGKITDTYIESENEEIHLRFEKHIAEGKVYIPGIIKIVDKNNETEVNIKIEKFTSSEVGNIRFIPARDYERILLK